MGSSVYEYSYRSNPHASSRHIILVCDQPPTGSAQSKKLVHRILFKMNSPPTLLRFDFDHSPPPGCGRPGSRARPARRRAPRTLRRASLGLVGRRWVNEPSGAGCVVAAMDTHGGAGGVGPAGRRALGHALASAGANARHDSWMREFYLRGGAVQGLKLVEIRVECACHQRLKLKCYELLSSFAFIPTCASTSRARSGRGEGDGERAQT